MHDPVTTDHRPARRWATRREAMAYAKIGSTTMNGLLQSSSIYAKKLGGKVVVDLNSVDDFYSTLPSVGANAHRSA